MVESVTLAATLRASSLRLFTSLPTLQANSAGVVDNEIDASPEVRHDPVPIFDIMLAKPAILVAIWRRNSGQLSDLVSDRR